MPSARSHGTRTSNWSWYSDPSLMRRKLEYAAAWPFLKIMGILPRPLARGFAIAISQVVYLLHFRLRQVGMRNLAMVFPERTLAERRRILRGVSLHWGGNLPSCVSFRDIRRRTLTTSLCTTGLSISRKLILAAKACFLSPLTLEDGSSLRLRIPCMGIGCTW